MGRVPRGHHAPEEEVEARLGLIHGRAPVEREPGQDAAAQEFPEAGEWPEEHLGRLRYGEAQVDVERDDGDEDRQPEDVEPQLPGQPQNERPDEVELFFDRQAPQVQHGFLVCDGVEISGFADEHEVDDEGRAAGDVFAKLLEFVCDEGQRAEDKRRGHDKDEGREQPADASAEKSRKREIARVQAGEDMRRDEISRDHEEDVDADEPARQSLWKGVINHDREDREGPQAIDFRSVG